MTDIRIKVLNEEQYDGGEFPFDTTVKELLKFLGKKLEEIPEEFRDNAHIDISSESGYEGSHYASVEIYYYRPQTEAEIKAAKDLINQRAEQQRQKELAALAILKAKYE